MQFSATIAVHTSWDKYCLELGNFYLPQPPKVMMLETQLLLRNILLKLLNKITSTYPMLTSFNEEPTYMCTRGADPDKIPGQQLPFYCKFNHAKLLRICLPAATVSSRGPGTQHMSTSHLLDKFVYLTIGNWEPEFYIYSSSNI